MPPSHAQVADDPISLLIPGFLEIRRQLRGDVKMRQVRAILDGELLTMLEYGESKIFPIRPGKHTLLITNTARSKELSFHVASGETVTFDCAQTGTTMGMFWYVLLGVGQLKIVLNAAPSAEPR